MVAQFQFLIGTIKTTMIQKAAGILKIVSIPYRYYKNFQGIERIQFDQWEFQFLIGTIKTYNLFDYYN